MEGEAYLGYEMQINNGDTKHVEYLVGKAY